MSIEFRERPTMEHFFQLEVRKSGALIGHIRYDANGFCQYSRGSDNLLIYEFEDDDQERRKQRIPSGRQSRSSDSCAFSATLGGAICSIDDCYRPQPVLDGDGKVGALAQSLDKGAQRLSYGGHRSRHGQRQALEAAHEVDESVNVICQQLPSGAR
jgi:hypothetical protein